MLRSLDVRSPACSQQRESRLTARTGHKGDPGSDQPFAFLGSRHLMCQQGGSCQHVETAGRDAMGCNGYSFQCSSIGIFLFFLPPSDRILPLRWQVRAHQGILHPRRKACRAPCLGLPCPTGQRSPR